VWKVSFFCEGLCLRSVAENVEAGFSRAFEILQGAALKGASASGRSEEISRRSPPQGMQEALLCLELPPPTKHRGKARARGSTHELDSRWSLPRLRRGGDLSRCFLPG
jgi:hypothetical protein